MNEMTFPNRRETIYVPVTGMIEEIAPMDGYGQPNGCYQILTLQVTGNGMPNNNVMPGMPNNSMMPGMMNGSGMMPGSTMGPGPVINRPNQPNMPDTMAEEEMEGMTDMTPAQMPREQIVRVIIGPETYFVNGVRLYEGMTITAFYDGNAPMVLIYPPQYRAVAVAEQIPGQNVMMGRFNGSLTAEDRSLRLNLDEGVDILTENGQNFYGSLAGRTLLVVYGATTRSIPPQTTPYQVIVFCKM